jgi:hypothetical protein
LSATPFRTDDNESQRLARRFDGRWLAADQEQLYMHLSAFAREKCRARSRWFRPNTLMAKCSQLRNVGALGEFLEILQSTRGGCSETAAKEFAVIPTLLPNVSAAVIIVTPVANVPRAFRKSFRRSESMTD